MRADVFPHFLLELKVVSRLFYGHGVRRLQPSAPTMRLAMAISSFVLLIGGATVLGNDCGQVAM